MRDDFKKYLTGAILAGAVMAPGAVWAQVDDVPSVGAAEEDLDEVVEEDLESGDVAEKPWSLSATLVNRFYQGMFTDLENDDPGLNPKNGQAADPSAAFDRWLNIYVLGGSYTYEDFSFGGEVLWTHWLTVGGGLNEPNEIRFEDASVSASWSGYTIEAIDTKVSAGYELGIPLSDVSRTSGLIVSNSLSAGVSRTFFDKLTLKYSLGGSWLPHDQKVATADPEVVGIFRENERVADDVVAIGGVNTEFALSNSLSASIGVWEDLRASIGYTFTKYWTYDQGYTPDDPETPNVDGIQYGRMTSDLTTATASLSYPIGDYVSLSGGLRTVQQPKTPDNSSFQFPFWNFTSAARNSSAFQLAITGSY